MKKKTAKSQQTTLKLSGSAQKKETKLKKAVQASRRGELKKRYRYTVLRQELSTEVADYVQKLNDDKGVAPGSRLDKWWQQNTIRLIAHNYFDQGRVKLLGGKLDPETVVKRFHLRGIQWGNWVTQEDRYNYLFALAISLRDLKDLTGVPYHVIGFNNKLTLAIGARGQGSALAHYEPARVAINLTRYQAVPKNLKLGAMLNTGGAGSLSHEWAHALDHALGLHREFASAKPFRSIRWVPDQKLMKSKTAAGSFERCLAAINTNTDGTKSRWRELLDEKVQDPNNKMGTYFIQRIEIWARVFEAYLAMKLAESGGKNVFISKSKYVHQVYPPKNLIKKAEPYIKEILAYAKKL